MTRARLVLRVIDQVLVVEARHPSLLAEHLRYDKSAAQLIRAFNRYRRDRKRAGSTMSDEYTGDELAERVDRAFEDQTAVRRRARYEKRAAEFAADRRSGRASMSLLELVREITERAVSLSTVSAGNTEPSRSGGSDTAAPPRQALLDDDPRWREHEAVIRRRAVYMLELLDEAQGWGAVANPTLTAVEKDALIRHHSMEGKTALQVYDELGPYIAGSPETVRRKRREKGLDHHGLPKADGA